MRADLAPDVSWEDKYDPAMAITDQGDADGYFEFLVQHNMSFGTAREEAERIERSNLGYWAGYYSHATRERVERLFRCAHPFFGSIAEKGPMSPEEIFEMGLRMGADLANRRPKFATLPPLPTARIRK